MKGHQIGIFATKVDLEELLRGIESQRQLQYVRAGLFAAPLVHRLATLIDINLGVAVKGDSNSEVRYLVTKPGETINVEPVPQYGGGTKYSIGSQRLNPKTMVFRPGGVFEGNCIISGDASTISDDPVSLEIFGLFSREIKRRLSRIRSFWVGKEAEGFLNSGWRLTPSIHAPPFCDLKRD